MPDDPMADNSATPVPFQPGMDPTNPTMATTPSAPSQTTISPAASAVLAPTPMPPDVQQHMGWLGNVLDKVGSILGGDKTYSVKKDTDGNISVSEDPSTRGEKWGRVAAAALTGAGAGLANSQGPGGPARAAAAGIQAGAQMPQQQKQQAQQDATFEQQTQMRNAQKALTQQQIAQSAFNMQQKGIALTQAQVDRSNAIQDWIGSNKVNQDLGTFKNMDEAMKMTKTNPDAMANHANGKLHFAQEADGKVHVWNMDQAWLDQKNDKDVTFKELVPGDSPDAPMQFKDHVIQAGSMTNAKIEQAEEGNTNRIAKYQLDLGGLQEKADAAKQASQDRQAGIQERAQAARQATAERAENAAANRSLQRQIAEGKGYISGTPTPPAPAGSYDAKFPPVQNFAKGTDGINPKQIGKPTADVTKAARLSQSAIYNSQQAINLLKAHPDLVGRLNSLGDKWQFAVGVDHNDPLTQLQGYIEQSTQASLGAHNYRGTKYAQDKEAEVTNHLKNDPSSIIAQLQTRINSNQQFADDYHNMNLYGTLDGPDRKFDVSQGQGQPQTQVPTGKFPATDKQGKIVGYADDKKGTNYHAF
jgi:hypothetical protein